MTKTNGIAISMWIASPAYARIGWVASDENRIDQVKYYR
jgi:hypothetical protein